MPETLGDILVRAGRKGQKTGGGWYDHAPGDRTLKPSDTTAGLLKRRITSGSALTVEDIATRLTQAMADEGAAILAEGIALKSSDIDLVEVHGYGDPRWRGGPMVAQGVTRAAKPFGQARSARPSGAKAWIWPGCTVRPTRSPARRGTWPCWRTISGPTPSTRI